MVEVPGIEPGSNGLWKRIYMLVRDLARGGRPGDFMLPGGRITGPVLRGVVVMLPAVYPSFDVGSEPRRQGFGRRSSWARRTIF